MKKRGKLFRYAILASAVLALAAVAFSALPASARGFTHAPIIIVDGEEYHLAGAPDGPGGATDIPGHSWIQAGRDRLVGKHYNTGPFGLPQWWSSDADDGQLLYIVNGIIDTWSAEKAQAYAARGYVHYHELLKVSDASLHPTKVVWLKHTARAFFNLDGGPHPEYGHQVSPGIDYQLFPNEMTPYSP
jgi:selenium-binding protein 1